MRKALLIVAAVLLVPLLMGAEGYLSTESLLVRFDKDNDDTKVGHILAMSKVTGHQYRTFHLTAHPTYQIHFDVSSEGDTVDTADPASREFATTTNPLTITTMDFDASTEETLTFQTKLPDFTASTGNATLTFEWFEATAEASKSVSWGIKHLAIASGESLDQATTTVTVSSATNNTTDTVHHATIVDDIADFGWSKNDTLILKVIRSAGDATDDFANDASLFNFSIEVPITTVHDS